MKCEFPIRPYSQSTTRPEYLKKPDEKKLNYAKRKLKEAESEKKRQKQMEQEAEVDESMKERKKTNRKN